MKTPLEMLRKLRLLEREITQKNRELNTLHRRHKMNAQGNMRFESGRINKNTYTNSRYLRNIANAARIVYNERKPLMANYNRTAAKYRERLGLPAMNQRGWPWPKTLIFSRSKNRYTPLPNVGPIYKRYTPHRIGMGSGSGGGYHSVGIHVNPYEFYPNVQLMNALSRTAKNQRHRSLAKSVRNAWLASVYRPSKTRGPSNKGGGMYLKTLSRFNKPNSPRSRPK